MDSRNIYLTNLERAFCAGDMTRWGTATAKDRAEVANALIEKLWAGDLKLEPIPVKVTEKAKQTEENKAKRGRKPKAAKLDQA